MLLLREEHVIRDVLHDLAHERETAFHALSRLLVDDAAFAWRHWEKTASSWQRKRGLREG